MSVNPFIDKLKPYFDWLSSEFEHFANEAVKNDVSPDDIARAFLSDEGLRDSFNQYFMPEIHSRVVDFWQQNNQAVLAEMEKLPGLKARFGGDMGPQRSQKLFERVGIYYDTVIVPDPILRAVTMRGPVKWRDYYTLKYCIAQVLFRDIYLADVYPPIAVIFGEDHLYAESSHFETLTEQSVFDAIAVANAIFAQDFDTEEEAKQFFRNVGTHQALAREVAKPDLLRFDEEAGSDPLEQIEALYREMRINVREEELPEDHKGAQGVWAWINARMMVTNELLQASADLDAHPVIQAPISNHWLITKARVNAELLGDAIGERIMTQLPITNALLSQNLEWLSNVPLDALIRLREQGFLSDLRATVAGNIADLSSASLDSLERVSRQVDVNLQTALSRHQEQLKSLNQNLVRELATSAPTLLLSIAGAIQPLFGAILPSWIPVAATVGGAVGLKDVVSNVANHITERRRLGKTPIGILWHARSNAP